MVLNTGITIDLLNCQIDNKIKLLIKIIIITLINYLMSVNTKLKFNVGPHITLSQDGTVNAIRY